MIIDEIFHYVIGQLVFFLFEIKEIIFALSPTLDGDTTSFYISKRLSKYNLKMTTISRGIPIGGEVHYLDENTLNAAYQARKKID